MNNDVRQVPSHIYTIFGLGSVVCSVLPFIFFLSGPLGSPFLYVLFSIAGIALGVVVLKKNKREAAAGAHNKFARILAIIGICLGALLYIPALYFIVVLTITWGG